MRIFADTQSIKQAEISITEAHSNPLWSVDSRGAGQQRRMWREMIIFADKQTDNQADTEFKN